MDISLPAVNAFQFHIDGSTLGLTEETLIDVPYTRDPDDPNAWIVTIVEVRTFKVLWRGRVTTHVEVEQIGP